MGNLSTPDSVQKQQTALHAKAKAEPGYRFYALYDKISREDILAHAYAQCRSNKGAPGVDRQDFEAVEAYGVERWMGELALALRQETYRPEPIRRVYIPKANGKLSVGWEWKSSGLSGRQPEIDGMIVRVHQLAPALKRDSQNRQSGDRAVVRRPKSSRLSMRSAIWRASPCRPVSDTTASEFEPLISGVAIGALLADKAFDDDWLRAELDRRGAIAVNPPKADRKDPIDCDFEMYKWRHLIENFLCKLKEFRRIATRYEKTDASYSAMIHLVGSAIAIR